jgi:hypothetical protein
LVQRDSKQGLGRVLVAAVWGVLLLGRIAVVSNLVEYYAEAALRPGNTVGQVFAAHAEVLTKAGYAGHFLNACPDASPIVRS